MFSLVIWPWVIKVIWVSSLCQCLVLEWRWFWSLFGFGIEMIVACFQKWNYMSVLANRQCCACLWGIWWHYGKWPRCLRGLMLMPSGPVELLFVLFEMAKSLCSSKSYFLSVKVFDCMVHLSIGFFVLYGVTFVNCLLVYINDGCFSSKVNASVCCVGVFLLDSFAMVPHREIGLCLWSILSRCYFQVFVLCSCICLFMSLLGLMICVSDLFCL